MLPKKNRVTKSDLDKVFKSGFFCNSTIFSCKYILLGKSEPKISFVVSKNIAKLATRRNSLRRKGYLALSQYLKRFPTGFRGVFIFKKNEPSVQDIKNELEKILSKIN